ncbi:DUF4325 domain-containing protein [Acetobacteraceae bacterium]|nr:DUF4325 domain-containing protein [Acetobacteraceae bacterium]
MNTIRISKDFAPRTGARFKRLGPHSGEEFQNLLLKRLASATANDPLYVYIDGKNGYFSSFLEEAFGGLVRTNKITPADLEKKLIIEADCDANQPYVKQAKQYIQEAIARLNEAS